jgi:hypothetical protein
MYKRELILQWYDFSRRRLTMAKIMHVQTVLMVEDIDALKAKTGETNTKDALAKAVSHYLECEYTEVKNMWTTKLENVVNKRTKEIYQEEN